MSTQHQRLDYARQSADLFKKYLDFSMAFRMDEKLALLVDIRASQLNGCAFCLDMHVKQARMQGERELRLRDRCAEALGQRRQGREVQVRRDGLDTQQQGQHQHHDPGRHGAE